MEQDEPRYYLLKWKKDMKHQGWPRHEVMRMPVIEDTDYDILEENLTFEEANEMKKKLESPEVEGVS